MARGHRGGRGWRPPPPAQRWYWSRRWAVVCAVLVVAAAVGVVEAACPSGWTGPLAGRCYKWVSSLLTKSAAASNCATLGTAVGVTAKLATVPDSGAASAVLGTSTTESCADLATSSPFWIGLTGPSSSKSSGWSWDNGDTTTFLYSSTGRALWYSSSPSGGSSCGVGGANCKCLADIYGCTSTYASCCYAPEVSASGTPTPSITPSGTPTKSKTASITPSGSRTPSIAPSVSVTPSGTRTRSGTASGTRTRSLTPTVTRSASTTPTWTKSSSTTPSVTRSASNTATVTRSSSITPSGTGTGSGTATITRTASSTSTGTGTQTATRTTSRTVTPTRTCTATRTPSTTPLPLVLTTVGMAEVSVNGTVVGVRVTLTGGGFTNYDLTLTGVVMTVEPPDIVWTNLAAPAQEQLSLDMGLTPAYWRGVTFVLTMAGQTARITKLMTVPPSGVVSRPAGGALLYGSPLSLVSRSIGGGGVARVVLVSGSQQRECAVDAGARTDDVVVCTPWALGTADFGRAWGVAVVDGAGANVTLPAAVNISVRAPLLQLGRPLTALPSAAGAPSRALAVLSARPPRGLPWVEGWNATITRVVGGRWPAVSDVAYAPAAPALAGCTAAAGDGAASVRVQLGGDAVNMSVGMHPSAPATAYAAPVVMSLRGAAAAEATAVDAADVAGDMVLVGRGFVDRGGQPRLLSVAVDGSVPCAPLVVANDTSATCRWGTSLTAAGSKQPVWNAGVTVAWPGGTVATDSQGAALAVSARLRSVTAVVVPPVVRGGQTLHVLGAGVGRGGAVNVSVGGMPCTAVVVVTVDAITCLAPALLGVDLAPVTVTAAKGLPSTEGLNVSYVTVLQPAWSSQPPAGNDTTATRVALVPAGRASGAAAPWPAPALALVVTGVGSGTCVLLLLNATVPHHPEAFGVGLGLPPQAAGSGLSLVGAVTGRVVISPGQPPPVLQFAGLGLWAGSGSMATVAASCQDSNGKVTQPAGVWHIVAANLSADWVSVSSGFLPPAPLPRATLALGWSGGSAPFSMAMWSTCIAAVMDASAAAALPLATPLVSAVDALGSVSIATGAPTSSCNATGGSGAAQNGTTASAGAAPCWLYAVDGLSLATAPPNVSLVLMAECTWTPTGERVRLPPQSLFVPPFATVWDGALARSVALFLGESVTTTAFVVHAIPPALWATVQPTCTLRAVSSTGNARLTVDAARAVYRVTPTGAVTPAVVLGVDGEPGGELVVQVVCNLWDAQSASPPLTLHAKVVRVAPAAPLPVTFIASDGVTPFFLPPLLFAFTDDQGAPVSGGTLCTLASGVSGAELRMGAATLVPDTRGFINVTGVRIVTTLDAASVTLVLTCSRPYGDAPLPLTWSLTATLLAVTACAVPATALMPDNGHLPPLVLQVGPPGWQAVACLHSAAAGSAADADIAAALSPHVSCSFVVVGGGSWNSSAAPSAADARNALAAPPSAGRSLHATAGADGLGVVVLDEVQVVGSHGAWYTLEGSCTLGSAAVPGAVQLEVRIVPCGGGSFPRGLLCNQCPDATFAISGDAECTSCPPDGATCVAGAITLLPHFFRPPSNFEVPVGPQMQLFQCYNEEACTLNATTLAYGCAAGYTGMLCGVCAAGYAKFGTVCRPCWETASSALLLTAMVVGSVAFLAFVGLRKGGDGSMASWRPPLKMLLGFVQALSALRVFKAGGTTLFRNAMGWTDTVNASPLSSGGMQCLLQWDMLAQYVAVVALPAVGAAACVALVVAVLAVQSTRCARRALAFDGAAWYAAFVEWRSRERHTATLVFLLFLGYMPTVTASFRVLYCYDHKIDGAWWLASDLSVECYQGQHAVATTLAVAVLAGYGAGFPLLIFWALSRAPTARLRDPHFVAAFGFLYLGYRTAVSAGRRGGAPASSAVHALSAAAASAHADGQQLGWRVAHWVRFLNWSHCTRRLAGRSRTLVWWEATILLRKGCVVLLSTAVADPFYQVVGAVLLFALFTLVQQRYSPYSDDVCNRLEAAMLVDLYVTAAVSTLLLPTAVAGVTVSPATQRTNDTLSALLVVLNFATALALVGTALYLLVASLRQKATSARIASFQQAARSGALLAFAKARASAGAPDGVRPRVAVATSRTPPHLSGGTASMRPPPLRLQSHAVIVTVLPPAPLRATSPPAIAIPDGDDAEPLRHAASPGGNPVAAPPTPTLPVDAGGAPSPLVPLLRRTSSSVAAVLPPLTPAAYR